MVSSDEKIPSFGTSMYSESLRDKPEARENFDPNKSAEVFARVSLPSASSTFSSASPIFSSCPLTCSGIPTMLSATCLDDFNNSSARILSLVISSIIQKRSFEIVSSLRVLLRDRPVIMRAIKKTIAIKPPGMLIQTEIETSNNSIKEPVRMKEQTKPGEK